MFLFHYENKERQWLLESDVNRIFSVLPQTKEELMHVRRELISSPKSPKTSLAAQAILRRVENERDDAVADLHRMTTERDSLRERIKVCGAVGFRCGGSLVQWNPQLNSLSPRHGYIRTHSYGSI
eukprot:GHVL01015541.1.p1 GENE.GHVL01015541.1~~GHVL01015541.1.p1  ORF type:complete len:125 (+),score=9.93 GHVL01015541.1:99-473(+)